MTAGNAETLPSERVLVCAPTGRDGALVRRLLDRAGISAVVCAGIDALCRAMPEGAGVLVIAEEALGRNAINALTAALDEQPAWSDVPLVLFTTSGDVTRVSHGRIASLVARGSVTLLERPTRVRTMVSAVQSALRARRRQYEVHSLLERVETSARDQERLRQQAESANALKDQFLATVSHELRTPLNAMLGWTRMLRTSALSDEKRTRALETIERNATAQARLIDDLLDLGRIVSGKLAIDSALVRLEDVLAQAIESVRPAAEARGLEIRAQTGRDAAQAGTFVRGDADRLQQVVWNLLSNAMKFTPAGGRVHVALAIDAAGDCAVIEVRDTGRGITPEFLPRVFDRFRQADGSSTRAHGGLGLGLSIVQHLVELHGGTITAASDGPGRGATFTVRLPLAREAADTLLPRDEIAPRAVTWPVALTAARVLVVDDEPDARELVAAVLSDCGAHVTLAASTAEALACIADAAPDVLVSDVGMPGDDGHALVRRVRALADPARARTPAIALSAYTRSEDRARSLDAGFDRHLAKPFDAGELLEAVAAMMRRA